MHVVIKEVGTVQAFIEKKSQMEKQAISFYTKHKQMVGEQWNHGEPIRVWENGLPWIPIGLYIEYEDGYIHGYEDNYVQKYGKKEKVQNEN